MRNFRFLNFPKVLLVFSLVVLTKQNLTETLGKIENLISKYCKYGIHSFSCNNTLLVVQTHQISTRSEHYKMCTDHENVVLE